VATGRRLIADDGTRLGAARRDLRPAALSRPTGGGTTGAHDPRRPQRTMGVGAALDGVKVCGVEDAEVWLPDRVVDRDPVAPTA
jgi:hypothetical protein